MCSHVDIDECSTNSHSCNINAVCSNAVGSYACACKAGYTSCPMYGNPRQSLILDFTPLILDSRDWISVFVRVELRFLISSCIPDYKSKIFPGFRNQDSLIIQAMEGRAPASDFCLDCEQSLCRNWTAFKKKGGGLQAV